MPDKPSDMHYTLEDLPREFLSEAMNCFKIFTVPLLSFHPGDPQIFQSIGCATLIRCGGRIGLLTAWHVLHATTPPLPIGKDTDHSLGLIISERDILRLPCRYLIEQPIGEPRSEEHGPDLTFIEIPTMPQLATLKDRKSFWNLDSVVLEGNTVPRNESHILCTMGTPAENQAKTFDGFKTDFAVEIGGYFTGLRPSKLFDLGEHDYIDTLIEYTAGRRLPESFGGVSGGGLWSFTVAYKAGLKDPKVNDLLFCGVAFYETGKTGGEQYIRHHYLRSIYGVTVTTLRNGQLAKN
jgi:hypothetical protein